jgi:hypothetical protein
MIQGVRDGGRNTRLVRMGLLPKWILQTKVACVFPLSLSTPSTNTQTILRILTFSNRESHSRITHSTQSVISISNTLEMSNPITTPRYRPQKAIILQKILSILAKDTRLPERCNEEEFDKLYLERIKQVVRDLSGFTYCTGAWKLWRSEVLVWRSYCTCLHSPNEAGFR